MVVAELRVDLHGFRDLLGRRMGAWGANPGIFQGLGLP